MCCFIEIRVDMDSGLGVGVVSLSLEVCNCTFVDLGRKKSIYIDCK